MAVTPKVIIEGAKIILVLDKTTRLELDLFHALALSAELDAAGRELMKP